ncbi:hypothetical protein EMCRGX_G005053 [Ephydatia muelleri]
MWTCVSSKLSESKINAHFNDVGHLDLTHLALPLYEGATDTNNKTTRLYVASEKGDYEGVKRLLGAGSDVNEARSDDGWSPLYTASRNGHLDVMKTLLEAGANINQATKLAAVMLAMMGNKAALVERLYLHLQDPSSEPEPEREDVPDATPESEDSSESSSEGVTTESTPESTETMLRVCEKLGIPVALDKLEGPATTITFLGITIDTTLQQLRLPPDKLQEMTLMSKFWLGKHKTTKRDLLS